MYDLNRSDPEERIPARASILKADFDPNPACILERDLYSEDSPLEDENVL